MRAALPAQRYRAGRSSSHADAFRALGQRFTGKLFNDASARARCVRRRTARAYRARSQRAVHVPQSRSHAASLPQASVCGSNGTSLRVWVKRADVAGHGPSR